MRHLTSTLRQLSDLLCRDLSEALPGGLHARVEALGEAIGRLANVEASNTCLKFVPAFHGAFALLVGGSDGVVRERVVVQESVQVNGERCPKAVCVLYDVSWPLQGGATRIPSSPLHSHTMTSVYRSAGFDFSNQVRCVSMLTAQ